MHIARGIGGVVHAHREVQRAQGIARNLVDFRAEERAECAVHTEGPRVAVSQIHARREHGDSQLAALFDTHRQQLAVQLHVLGSIEHKLHTHIVEGLGDDDTTVEDDAAPIAVGIVHTGLGALRGLDVQRRIHRLARKLNIRTILDDERLERNDRQRVFHLTVRQGVTTAQLQVVSRRVQHAQRAAAHQVDIVGVVGIEVGHHVGTLGYVYSHVHL